MIKMGEVEENINVKIEIEGLSEVEDEPFKMAEVKMEPELYKTEPPLKEFEGNLDEQLPYEFVEIIKEEPPMEVEVARDMPSTSTGGIKQFEFEDLESNSIICNGMNGFDIVESMYNQGITSDKETVADRKRFQCEYCDYGSNHKADLMRHSRKHAGVKPFKCCHCDFSSSDKSNLVRHIKTHTGEKPYTCEYCKYKCARKGDLRRHEQTHTGEKPFHCDLCTFRCSCKNNLIRHQRKHTGEKPFICSYCDLEFSFKQSMVRHTRRHTGEKPFHCPHCQYESRDSTHLGRHIKRKHL